MILLGAAYVRREFYSYQIETNMVFSIPANQPSVLEDCSILITLILGFSFNQRFTASSKSFRFCPTTVAEEAWNPEPPEAFRLKNNLTFIRLYLTECLHLAVGSTNEPFVYQDPQ
jgi:hypothetical protein